MHISRFQYISNYQSECSHIEQVKAVVKGGANWIQYRPKGVDDKVIIDEGKQLAAFCKAYKVTFIMNDWVDIAKELDADGVHLGKSDMSISKARQILGSNKIIGGTANTIDDIYGLVDQGVDYIGLGPFRFTHTKKNLSPVLGLKGYQQIIEILQKKKIDIPIVSIGGILESDIKALLNIGIYGIAVSSVISEANNVSMKVDKFKKTINAYL